MSSVAIRSPDAPGQPGVAFTAPTSVTVSWYAPNSYGAPILEFQVRFADNNTYNPGTVVSTGKNGKYTATVTRGKWWFFSVRARNAAGWSPWSLTRGISIPNVPDTPAQPFLNLHLPSTLYAWWNPPNNNGAAILGYEVQLVGVQDQRLLWVPVNNFIWLYDLARGGSYWVIVRANNSQGWSGWSERSDIRIPFPPALMDAPTLTYLPSVPTSMHASWTKPWDGGAEISWYDLQYSDDPNFSNYRIASTQGLSIWVDNLTPGKTWYFRVRAKNSQGDGPWGGPGYVSSKFVVFGPRVVYGGQHRYTVPYVKHDGIWKLAVPYVKDAGTYRFAGG